MVLYFIRKIKVYFAYLNLHRIFNPLTGFLLNLAYLTKFSKWRKEHADVPFNDFFLKKWDYDRRFNLYKYLIETHLKHEPINYLEFGVAEGRSFKWWLKNYQQQETRFYGFDTFTGLPEDWNMFKKGAMSAGGKFPDVDDSRAKFYQGIFQDTLPPFLKTFYDDKKKVIHLDADLFTATLYVLTSMAPFLKKGDILIFDEFAVPQHEFLAFYEFSRSYYLKYKVVAAANNYYFVAIEIQ